MAEGKLDPLQPGPFHAAYVLNVTVVPKGALAFLTV
jgi:hypothetical protein